MDESEASKVLVSNDAAKGDRGEAAASRVKLSEVLAGAADRNHLDGAVVPLADPTRAPDRFGPPRHRSLQRASSAHGLSGAIARKVMR
jgi:hypothetical protein